MRTKTLWESPAYKNFVNERNESLEVMHSKAQQEISQILHEWLSTVETALYGVFAKKLHGKQRLTIELLIDFKNTVKHSIYSAIDRSAQVDFKLQKMTWALAYFAELEALSRATGKLKHESEISEIPAPDLVQLTTQSYISYSKILNRISERLGSALARDLPSDEAIEYVKGAFPKLVRFKKKKRVIRSVESDAKNGNQVLVTDFLSDGEWNDIISYLRDELPKSRFSDEVLSDDEQERYEWEYEKELTDNFVKAFHDGEIPAANELGITEFVWVSVIDNRTCDECCLPRNGMTTTEIEEAISAGILYGDCDAVTPPAHPNCRCQIAPVGDSQQLDSPDWAGFNSWLDAE